MRLVRRLPWTEGAITIGWSALLVVVCAVGGCQGDEALPGLSEIREADIRRDIDVLAGDHMRGREAGTLDELRASAWIAERAREAGLEPADTGASIRDGTPFRATISVDRFQYPSVNVVARVRGTGGAAADEHVLFSAHQDHDGIKYAVAGDSIWNGADDNASASVALAIGRAFAAAPARRSALFVWHGAEEKGLLGSRWHAANPVVPREKIVAVLNADMIGRNHPDTAALLGAQPPHRNSPELVAMALEANRATAGFVVDSLWDRPDHPEGFYFRSDHLPYARAGIPALFFTSVLHPDYHTERDDPAAIDVGKLARIARWMYATGRAAADAEASPRVDPEFELER